MNWRRRLRGFRTGDKIIVTTVSGISGYYTEGKTYTLHRNYIKNGQWMHYGSGTTGSPDVNYWDTEEHNKNGIHEKNMELV